MMVKKRVPKNRNPETLSKLTETEQDLLRHLEHGYQLETDSSGSDPMLRKVGGEEVIRSASTNRNTVEALQERGLITEAKTHDPLKSCGAPPADAPGGCQSHDGDNGNLHYLDPRRSALGRRPMVTLLDLPLEGSSSKILSKMM